MWGRWILPLWLFTGLALEHTDLASHLSHRAETFHSKTRVRWIRLRRRVIEVSASGVGGSEGGWQGDGPSRAALARQLRRHSSRGDSVAQWVVSAKGPITAAFRRIFEACAKPGAVGNYVPDNGLWVVGPPSIEYRRSLLACPGVLFATLLVDEDKFEPFSLDSSSLETVGPAVQMYTWLVNGLPPHLAIRTKGEITVALEEACPDGAHPRIHRVHNALIMVEFKRKLRCRLVDVHVALARIALVHWIEKHHPARVQNFWARGIVQSGNSSYAPLWGAGLTGSGQTVAMSDTGVDYDSCFFSDATRPVPIDRVDPLHRKIIYYRAMTDKQDHEAGHGTHVAGSIAGVAECRGVTAVQCADLNRFQGLAHEAKLAVFDIGDGSGSLNLPRNTYSAIYDDSYRVGARVHSISWGTDSTHYDTLASELDRFAHDRPDFLAVVAAGNRGRKGYRSLTSPASAKNAITVGSSRSSVESFKYVGLGFGLDVSAPPPMTRTVTAVPARFGVPYTDARVEARIVSAVPFQACQSLTNGAVLHGNIVLVGRGSCAFTLKASHVEAAGGAMMLVQNNAKGVPSMMGTASDAASVGIPSAMVSLDDGNFLKNIAFGATARYPSLYSQSLSDALHAHSLSNFSSRGPTSDGRSKPDVVAPGEYITSAYSDGDPNSNQCLDSVISKLGTSMATPLVAAAAALLRQYFADGYYPSGSPLASDRFDPSAALLKAALINSGVRVDARRGDGIDPKASISNEEGYGSVRIASVLGISGLPDSPRMLVFDALPAVESGAKRQVCVRVDLSPRSTLELKVTLAWTDPPATLTSEFMLVNDLDLIVSHKESAVVYIGNQLRTEQSNGDSVPLFDSVNNVERIAIGPGITGAGTGGHYLLTIYGSNVVVAPFSKYAVIVTASGADGLEEVPASECGGAATRCPSNCSSRGLCGDHGMCSCDTGFGGADCGYAAPTLALNKTESGVFGLNVPIPRLRAGDWRYFLLDLSVLSESGAESVAIRFQNHSGSGDPDLYIGLGPGFPSLTSFTVHDTTCDPCGHATESRLRTQDIDLGTPLIVGIFGHCCGASFFTLGVEAKTPGAHQGGSTSKSLSSSNSGDSWSITALALAVGLVVLGLVVACASQRHRSVLGHEPVSSNERVVGIEMKLTLHDLIGSSDEETMEPTVAQIGSLENQTAVSRSSSSLTSLVESEDNAM